MKKFLSVMLIFLVLASFFSCAENDNEDASDSINDAENNLYYSQISTNEYFGSILPVEKGDDEYVEIEAEGDIRTVKVKTYSAYHLIDSFEEFTNVSNGLISIERDLFDKYSALFIERKYDSQWGEEIGFRDFSIIESKPTITLDRFVYENGLSNPMTETKQSYVLVPKSKINQEIAIKGTITVFESEIALYNSINLEIPNSFSNFEENKAWYFDSRAKIEQFCTESGLTVPEIYKPDENHSTFVVCTKRKTLKSYKYGGYCNFEHTSSVITLTYSYKEASLENNNEELKLDVIKIPNRLIEEPISEEATLQVEIKEIKIDSVID